MLSGDLPLRLLSRGSPPRFQPGMAGPCPGAQVDAPRRMHRGRPNLSTRREGLKAGGLRPKALPAPVFRGRRSSFRGSFESCCRLPAQLGSTHSSVSWSQ